MTWLWWLGTLVVVLLLVLSIGWSLWLYRWRIMLGAAQREVAEGNFEAAEKHLQESLQEATRRYGERHAHVAQVWSFAIELAVRQQNYKHARHAAQQALLNIETIHGDESAEAAFLHLRIASLALAEKSLREAEAHAERAVAIRSKARHVTPMELAEAQVLLGRIALRLEQHPRALSLFETALKSMEHHATSASLHQVRSVRLEAADLLALQEDHAEALRLLEPLLLMPKDDAAPEVVRDHAEAFSLQSIILAHQKQDHEAGLSLEKALSLWRKSLLAKEESSEHTKAVGESNVLLSPDGFVRDLARWATMQQEKGQRVEAAGTYEEAISLLRKREEPSVEMLGTLLGALGDCYRGLEHYEEAETAYIEALEWEQACKGDVHPDVSILRNNLASVYEMMERFDEALPLYQLALRSLEAAHALHPSIPAILNNLGGLLGKKERYEEADASYQRAIAVAEKILGAEHLEVGQILENHIALLRKMGDVDRAERLVSRAKKIHRLHEKDAT